MGLDMYLQAERFMWYNEEELKEKIKKLFPYDLMPKTVRFEVMYWRKANAIHNWFVENVQDGEDDCDDYEVSVEDLKRLVEEINEVLKSTKLVDGMIQNGSIIKDGKFEPVMQPGKVMKVSKKAKELMPTTKGFFFGGTDYDEFYYEDLKRTSEELTKILDKAENDEDWKHLSFYYRSSW